MSATVTRPAAARAMPRVCRHCGAPLADEKARAAGFCCAGCAYVFRLVHEHGLDGYYRIKDEVTVPADAAVFQPRDHTWLEEAQQAAEQAAGAGSPVLTLDVQGISCAGCVWLIERVFRQQPGARDIVVNAPYGSMRLRWTAGEFSAAEFARKLQAFGYLTGPAGAVPSEPETRGLLRRIGLCAAFAMNVMLFSFPVYFGMERDFEWAGLFALLNAALRADPAALPAFKGVDLGAEGYAIVKVTQVLPRQELSATEQEQARGQYTQWWSSAEGLAYYKLLQERLKVKFKVSKPAAPDRVKTS